LNKDGIVMIANLALIFQI